MTELKKDSTSVTIQARIQGLSEKERQQESFANFNSGELVGYFKAQYEELDNTYEVETGDIIERGDEKYRVEEIVANHRLGNEIIYKKARLRRI